MSEYMVKSVGKQCASCAHWLGERMAVLPDCKNVTTPLNAKGTFGCKNCMWFQKEKQGNSTCDKYEKWPVLK
jgi:hypothetical protein